MWYSSATDLRDLIEKRNQQSSESYDKEYKQKCEMLEKAVEQKVIAKNTVASRKEKIHGELVKKIVWFNPMSISGRLEATNPILLRDNKGTPIISNRTKKPITALELVEDILDDPSKLTDEFVKFLAADLGVDADVVSQFYAAPAEETEAEQPRSVSISDFLTNPTKLCITNALNVGVVVRYIITKDSIQLSLVPDSKEAMTGYSAVSLRAPAYRYQQDEFPEPDFETKSIDIIINED